MTRRFFYWEDPEDDDLQSCRRIVRIRNAARLLCSGFPERRPMEATFCGKRRSPLCARLGNHLVAGVLAQ